MADNQNPTPISDKEKDKVRKEAISKIFQKAPLQSLSGNLPKLSQIGSALQEEIFAILERYGYPRSKTLGTVSTLMANLNRIK